MMPATGMAAALAAGQTTALALAEAALAAIAARDGAVRAFITVDADGARAAAAAADARRAAGQARGPLDGVPVAIKDNIAVAGLPCTAGTGMARTSAQDATVTARLRAAGTVILGTLNMHEGALGATTDNPFHGRCDNPAFPGHTPGGSSGGSAAAVAAGFVPLTLGTDTMGSVRIPAAYCGLWGLKPTRGVIPVTGLVHLSWTLDSIGPIAACPDDLALALDVLTGLDPDDPASVTADLPTGGELGGAVLAVPGDDLLASCEGPVRAAFSQAAAAARAAGARIQPLSLPWEPGRLRRAGLLLSEVEGWVTLGDEITRTPEAFSAPFRAALAYGRDATAAKVAQAYRTLAETAALTARAMTGIDAVLMPTAPQRAFAHGAPVPADQADFTALANVAGLPALAFPLPAADGGPPCSAQVMGHRFAERRLIALARALHERLPS